jgi:hypothetical protein
MLKCSFAQGALLAAIWSGGLAAQVVACPSGVLMPYFGWDATECGKCNVYGAYLEYLTPPGLRSIRAGGPASGRVQENDTLIAVEGYAITTPAAWRQMRDAEPGSGLQRLTREALDQLKPKPGGYDHNFVLDSAGKTLAPAARVYEPNTGRVMEVHTTEPGVQLYTGNFLDGSLTSIGGLVCRQHAGFCLETQHFPDAVHHPNFPSVILRPGHVYKTKTSFRFSVQPQPA